MSDSFCNRIGYSPPGFSVHGVFQARILEWLSFPPPGDLPRSGIKPESPALAGRVLTTKPPEKPLMGEYKQAKLMVCWPLLRNQGAYHKQVVLLANYFPLFKSYSIVTIRKWKLCFWQMSFKIYCFISGNRCCRRIHLVPPGAHFAANSSRQVHWEADSISEMLFFFLIFDLAEWLHTPALSIVHAKSIRALICDIECHNFHLHASIDPGSQGNSWLCPSYPADADLTTCSSDLKNFCIYLKNYFFFFGPHSMRDLSSLTRDWTHTPCSRRADFQPLDRQGSPIWIYF